MVKMVTSLFLLLCALHLSSPNIVPNKFIHCEDGEKTDLVTGVYYSLYNRGRNESERGGVVTFYVSRDARREDGDYELMYKTLILDKGNHFLPGGSHYNSTLFAFKQYKKNVYQIYSKKLKGVVSYQHTKTGEYRLVVYGARMDVNLNILRKGSHFTSTLFVIRRMQNGYYQIVPSTLKTAVNYEPDGNFIHPFPRELVVINPDSKTGKKLDKDGVWKQGSGFQFDVAHVYQISLLPSQHVLHAEDTRDSNTQIRSDETVIFEAVNTGMLPVKHSFSHSESLVNTKVSLNEEESDLSVVMSGGIEATFTLTKGPKIFRISNKVGAGVEVGGIVHSELKSNSSSNQTDTGNKVSYNIEVEIDPEDYAEIIMYKNTTIGQRRVNARNQVIVTGDRLNGDGSYSTGVDLDSDAIFTIAKKMKNNENDIRRHTDNLIYMDSNVSVTYELSNEFRLNHCQMAKVVHDEKTQVTAQTN